MQADRRTIMIALKKVFTKPSSWIIGGVTFLAFCFALIWVANLALLRYLIASHTYTLGEKIHVFFTSIGNLGTNYTGAQLLIYGLLVILSALYMPMFVYHIRKQVQGARTEAAGIVGIVISVFGIGCSACGSILISSLIGVTATASFIGLLPFGGYEIGMLACVLLLVSLFSLSKKIAFPGVCHEGMLQKLKRFSHR